MLGQLEITFFALQARETRHVGYVVLCTLLSRLNKVLTFRSCFISGNWIVVFKKDTPKETLDAVVAQIESGGGSIKHKWYTSAKPVLYGFAGAIPDSVFGTTKIFTTL